MLLDLAELLACPRCGPPNGLVVLVERLDGRRVLDGRLDCPVCEWRWPVRDGALRFDLGRRPGAGAPAGPETAATSKLRATGPEGNADERAMMVVALLGARESVGPVLLGPGLRSLAARVARLAGGAEVVSLVPAAESGGGARERDAGSGAETAPDRVSRVVGADPSRLPLRPGRMPAVAVGEGATDPGFLEESARILSPGGRLVVLDPPPDLSSALSTLHLETMAEDVRALVARRG